MGTLYTADRWQAGQCWYRRFAHPPGPFCPRPGVYGMRRASAKWTRALRWCEAHKTYLDVLIAKRVPE